MEHTQNFDEHWHNEEFMAPCNIVYHSDLDELLLNCDMREFLSLYSHHKYNIIFHTNVLNL